MKIRKGTKRIIWIGTAVIAALLVTALIMGVIIVRPLDRFEGYTAEVLKGYDNPESMSDDKTALVNDALKTVKFSVLRASLERQFGYKIKGTEFTNSDDEAERIKHSVDWLKALAPKKGEFLLQLSWSQNNPQTDPLFMTDEVFVMENGEIVEKSVPIVFNRLIIVIPERNGEVQTVKLYPYYTANIDNALGEDYWYTADGKVSSNFYNVYEFTAKMYTSKLYDKFIENATFAPGAAASDEV